MAFFKKLSWELVELLEADLLQLEGPGEKDFSLGSKGNGSFGKDVQEPGKKVGHRNRLGPFRRKSVDRSSRPC